MPIDMTSNNRPQSERYDSNLTDSDSMYRYQSDLRLSNLHLSGRFSLDPSVTAHVEMADLSKSNNAEV
jgi:hypothetical protein